MVYDFGPKYNSSEKVKFGIAQKFRSFFFLTEMMLWGGGVFTNLLTNILGYFTLMDVSLWLKEH